MRDIDTHIGNWELVEMEDVKGDYNSLCKPELADFLALLKMDLIYHKGVGNHLYTTRKGKETAILDLVGGFGSTILGHNNPALKALMKQMIDEDKPMQAQGSIRPEAARLAKALNKLIQEGFAQFHPPQYMLHLLNTGTEATEAAIKHALIEWQNRKADVIFHAKQLRAKYRHRQLDENGQNHESLQMAIYKIDQAIFAINNLKPHLVAINGSFHGKTAGALAVTNPAYSEMYQSFAVHRSFISPDWSIEELQAFFNKFIIDLGEGQMFSPLIGVIAEVVQGEGGVKPLPVPLVKMLSLTCQKFHMPLIIDEVQTGMYRTGTFSASEQYGILPDYITLGKSLGGGVAKISALLVRKDRYQDEFSIVHTSTFAEDDYSAAIAVSALTLIKQLPKSAKDRAAEFNETLVLPLRQLSDRYPGVIKAIRSRGFLVGVEFATSFSGKSASFVELLAASGQYAYMLASYLLERHNIRVAATLNQTNTMRIEPSLFITPSDIAGVLEAFEDLIKKIAAGRFLAISAHIWRDSDKYVDAQICSFIPKNDVVADPNMRRVEFLTHHIDDITLKAIEPMFTVLTQRDIDYYLDEIAPNQACLKYHEQVIHGKNGQSVIFGLRGSSTCSRFFEKALRTGSSAAYDKVRKMALDAQKEGVHHIGLGQFTSIVTHNGLYLEDIDINQTTGNSFTVGSSYLAIMEELKAQGITAQNLTIGVVGAAGNIGNVIAQLMGDFAAELVLVHREPIEQSPKFRQAVVSIVANSNISLERIQTTTDLNALRRCDLVILSVNGTSKILEPEHLKNNSIVLDISVPSVVSERIALEKPAVTCLFGGHIKLPFDQKIDHVTFNHTGGEIYACMAETITTSLVNYDGSLSLGPLTKERVLQSIELAREVGMELGTKKNSKSKNR